MRDDHGRRAERGVAPRANNKTIWVLVADKALARILRRSDEGDALEDVEAIADPAAHMKEGEFERDSAGRRAGGAGHGSGQGSNQRATNTASAGEEEKHLEALAFARRIAAHLGDALQQKRFDELRIVAAPRFLGYLRKELDANVRATVSEEASKDLVHEGNETLSKRLFGRADDEAGSAARR